MAKKPRPGSKPLRSAKLPKRKAAAVKEHYRFYQLHGDETDSPQDEPIQLWLFRPDEIPEIDLAADAAALAQQAVPPWEQDGWEPPAPTREYPEGELLARMRKRLELTRGPPLQVRFTHYSGLLGKVEKTKEQKDMAKLREARNRVLRLGDTVRSNIFTDWYERCVVRAEHSKEWTQADDLYQSYVRHAQQYGPSLEDGGKATKTDQKVAREEMDNVTGWGRMMSGVSIRKRRAAGIYYPLRLKQGA